MPSWTQFRAPVPTLAINNAAWEGPTDAPEYVLKERDGRGSTRGWEWGVFLTIMSKASVGGIQVHHL